MDVLPPMEAVSPVAPLPGSGQVVQFGVTTRSSGVRSVSNLTSARRMTTGHITFNGSEVPQA